MANRYTPFRRNTGKRSSSVAIGSFAATAILFLALPLTQLIDRPDPGPGVKTSDDFALAAPDFDIIEQQPPITENPDTPELIVDSDFEPISLIDIGYILDGVGPGGGWGLKGNLEDINFEKLIETYNPIDLDKVPVPVHRVAPNYPYELKTSGIEGSVWLVFIVDEDGRVREVRVEGSSHREFEQPSINALRQWKFEPGRVNDRAVRTRMKIPMKFTIR